MDVRLQPSSASQSTRLPAPSAHPTLTTNAPETSSYRWPDFRGSLHIDGLEARAEAWRLTAVYLETGEVPDGFVIEECSDAEEARRIAEHYQRIIGTVVEQREGQR